VGYSRHAFWEAGGENENFVAYNPEDQERVYRWKTLGYQVARVSGPLFHLDHYRGDNSSYATENARAGHAYFEQFKATCTTEESIREAMKGWDWLDHKAIPGTGIFDRNHFAQEHITCFHLATKILEVLKDYGFGRELIDLGAGPGFYAAFLAKHGFNTDAYDLNPVDEMSFWDVSLCDLRDPDFHQIISQYDGKYHTVMCLEVGEHIASEYQDIVLDNIVGVCARNGLVILSWAIPGQGGYGHINCQPNEVIIAEMQKRNMSLHKGYTHKLRHPFANDPTRKYHGAEWFNDTIMVFVNVG
jgi:hypothetical protein